MKLTRLALVLIGIVIFTQFNNCSPMGDSTGLMNGNILGQCDPSGITNPNADINNINCGVADKNNISLNPGGDQAITSSQGDFDVGGTCNAGGFPVNVITWQLKNSAGTVVRNSGMIFNNQQWNGQCITGKFHLYIVLVPLTEDNNDRTGLKDPTLGTRSFYTLTMTLTGYDSTGTAQNNNVFGVRTINLTPQ
jgi:hypothetical protein